MNLYDVTHYRIDAVAINETRVDPICMDIKLEVPPEQAEHMIRKFEKVIASMQGKLFVHSSHKLRADLTRHGFDVFRCNDDEETGYAGIARRILVNLQSITGTAYPFRVTMESTVPGIQFHTVGESY